MRYIMESKLKPLQIFLFVFFVSLLLLITITVFFIYYFGFLNSFIDSIIELNYTDELEENDLLKRLLIIFGIWSVPALCATASWVLYKKINSISYGVAVLIQFAIINIILVINDVNIIGLLKNGYFDSIVVAILLFLTLYFFIITAITFWLAKQIFDIKDRNTGIEFFNVTKGGYSLDHFLPKMFILFLINIGILSIAFFLIYIFGDMYTSCSIFVESFGIKNGSFLCYLLIQNEYYFPKVILYIMCYLSVVVIFVYMVVKCEAFVKMVYFTRVSLLIHIIVCSVLTCALIRAGVVFLNANVISLAVAFLSLSFFFVVFGTMISSLSFWLTMKITGTEGHLPKKR